MRLYFAKVFLWTLVSVLLTEHGGAGADAGVGTGDGQSPSRTTVCVHSAPNPEWQSNTENYAHWLLAHAYPAVVATLERLPALREHSDVPVALVLVLVHGGFDGNGELMRWHTKYQQLLHPWAVQVGGTARVRVRVRVRVGVGVGVEARVRAMARVSVRV